MASSRRTYDTDSITLRTVFAKNPGNSNVPALRVLTADGTGACYWAVPSTLGQNPSFNEIITSAATYTADLSYNKFRLLAGEGIGMVDGTAGSNQTTLFAKAFSQLDVSGGNSVYAFQNNLLDPSVTFAGENGIQLRADPATNTFFIGASGTSNTVISTGIYGFNQIKVTPSASTITSSLLTWGGDFLTATSPSTLLRFAGLNDIQLSTNVTTNSVFFTISTFTSLGYLNISNAAFSAYPSTLSTVSSIYTQNNAFYSTIFSMSTNGVQWSSVQSSIYALAISTGEQFYTLTGLINARATIVQLNSEIAQVNSNLRSTVGGLGTAGYLSTGGSGTGDVTSVQLISTVTGLGTVGYISTAGGGSGDVTSAQLVSTVKGLGTSDYVSTLSLYSTLSTFSTALGAVGSGTLTLANLTSTVQGLGTTGYISSLSSITVSTLFNTGAISTYSLEVYGSNTLTNSGSTILRGATYLQGDTYVAGNITGAPNTIVNSSNLTSTILGLGTFGYRSSFQFNQLSTGFITVSSMTLFDTYTNAPNYLTVSGATLLLNSFFIGGGGGGGGGGAVTQLVAGTGISLDPANGLGNVTIANTGVLSQNLTSTVTGLGSASYVSTLSLYSTLSTFSTALGAVGGGTLTLANLTSTVTGLGTTGYFSTASLLSTVTGLGTTGYFSTASLRSTIAGLGTAGYFSTASLQSTVAGLGQTYLSSFSSFSTLNGRTFNSSNVTISSLFASNATMSNLTVSTITFDTGDGFIDFPDIRALSLSTFFINASTINVGSIISTQQLFVNSIVGPSTVSQLNLRSTVEGLGTYGYISSASLFSTNRLLTSSIAGLSNVAVTKIIQGTNITISPGTGLGEVTINAGGGGVTSAELTSTVQGLGNGSYPFTTISTTSIVLSTSMSNYALTASTNTLTTLPNLWMNNRIYGTYNPVNVVVSTLGAANVQLFEYDMGKYFLFSQANQLKSVNFPTVNQGLNGWNVVIKNMPTSAYTFSVSTTTGAYIAPGVATTIVCDGQSFYSI